MAAKGNKANKANTNKGSNGKANLTAAQRKRKAAGRKAMATKRRNGLNLTATANKAVNSRKANARKAIIAACLSKGISKATAQAIARKATA